MLDNKGFDLWADGYDAAVGLSDEENSYPFAGYKDVLGTIFKEIMSKKNARVLDIGFGTGTLTTKLYENGCDVYGQDFSQRMIELAKQKMENAHLYQGDFSKGNIKQIVVDAPVTITSSNRTAKFSQVNFITTSNAVIQNLSVSMDRSANSMEIPYVFMQSSGDLVLQNNTISYITGTRYDSYVIYVSPECKLLLDGNVINFTGNSDASKRCKVLSAFVQSSLRT